MWGHGVLPAALPAPFSATLSPALSVYLCANVGPQGLPVVRLPAPFVPHSASLGPAIATRVLSTPVPVSAPPTGLDECLFFISLVSDFLAVRFSVNSGCARRCSVSTYAAILVPSLIPFSKRGLCVPSICHVTYSSSLWERHAPLPLINIALDHVTYRGQRNVSEGNTRNT